MLYKFQFKSLPVICIDKPRDYCFDVIGYTVVKVYLSGESFLSYYFEEWDNWDE